MTESLFLSTSELIYFLSSLPVLVFVCIQIGRKFSKLSSGSFDFSGRYFLLGISIAVSSAIALISWQSEKIEPNYDIMDIDPEIVTVDMPVTIQEEIVEELPPPPKITSAPKIIDLIKINLVNDLVEKKEEDLVSEPTVESVPAPVVVETAVAPMVAPEIVELVEKPFEIFAEQMPRFPGCEDMEGSNKEKEACSQRKLLQYIADKLKYPAAARENGIEGLVVVRFIVSKEGDIIKMKVLRDIGAGCGKAALEVVSAMNELPESWTPGKQRGRPVNVQYTLPVKFKLSR